MVRCDKVARSLLSYLATSIHIARFADLSKNIPQTLAVEKTLLAVVAVRPWSS